MVDINKQEFLEKSSIALSEIFDDITSLEKLNFSALEKDHTALIIIDMINGFIKEGALSSPNIKNIISPIKLLMTEFKKSSMPIIAFADNHTENSPEFNVYPTHCLEGSLESEIVDELKDDEAYLFLKKNSTNGFLERDFQEALFTNPQINTFVVVGCCTDICIMQFCLTLKTFFNINNKNANIIVPVNAVETFDLGSHDSGLMNAISLKLMKNEGINLVKEII